MDESFGYLFVGSKPLKSVLLYHLSPPDWRYYFTGGEQAQLFDYLQTLHKGEDIRAFVARWKINMRKFIGTILLFCAISTYFIYAIYQNLQTQRNDVSISMNDPDVVPTSLTITVIGDTYLPETLMLIR